MKLTARMILALIVLAVSLIMLVWAFWPGPRIIRRQLLKPTEMQLPTPESYTPLLREFVWEHQQIETACLQLAADRFALIL